jgi:hypothetical protein
MFMTVHASQFDLASVRARLRWADAIDRLLLDAPADDTSVAELRHARAVLSDLDADVSSDDLHRLMAVVRRYSGHEASGIATEAEPLGDAR